MSFDVQDEQRAATLARAVRDGTMEVVAGQYRMTEMGNAEIEALLAEVTDAADTCLDCQPGMPCAWCSETAA